MAVAASAGELAMLGHAVHYALVAGGLVGVSLLLLPSIGHRVTAPPRGAASAMAGPGTTDLRRPQPAAGGVPAVVVPLTVLASLSAAGVHTAMVPAHLADPAVGAFFVVAALTQGAWAAAVVVRRPGRLALGVGVVVNLGLLAVWALSRTVGLAVVGIPAGEPVGRWDLAAAGWEAVVVVGCLAALRRPSTAGTAGTAWHPVAGAWLVACVLVLGALSMGRP